MPSSTAGFLRIGYRKLIPWLLGQPRRMAPSPKGGCLGLPFITPLFSLTADLPLAGRRSQLCRVTSTGPAWALPPCWLSVRVSTSVRAAPLSLSFSLCRTFCSSHSLCSGRDRSTGSQMSSSSSFTREGQGKPKPQSPLRKRGSLQSTTSPGEWRGVGAGGFQKKTEGGGG